MRNLPRVLSLSRSEILFLTHCLLVVAAVRLGLTLLSYCLLYTSDAADE